MQSRILQLLILLAFSAPSFAQKRSDSVVLKTRTGDIYGTLTVPSTVKQPVPVVIIIAGSGPTDRDGNNAMMKNNSLLMLGDSLSSRGLASLRFDKRGIGASKAAAKDESALRFQDYVSDVSGWITQLRKDKRFSQVFVAGHSEGSLIGMLAVTGAPVAGFISIAGAGKSADQLVMDQLAASKKVSAIAMDSILTMFRQLKATGSIDSVPSGYLYQSLLRKSVQPYFASWIRYDPATAIQRVTVPTFIIQGLSDLQVDSNQARLLAAAKPDARLTYIARMNHIFKDAAADDPTANTMSYYESGRPIKSELVDAIVMFVKANAAGK